MPYKITNKKNTLGWYNEYLSTKNIDRLPVSLIEEEGVKIKNRSVVFFANFEGTSVVVLSYKKGGSCVVVPVSEYNYPSSEFEVYLPKSNLVLQTWNARVCVPSKLKEVVALGKISDEDMHIALSHYNAVFESAEFKFPSLIGEPMAEIEEELAISLNKYLYKEALALPESKFIVMPQDFSLEIEEIEEFDSEDEEVLEMPNIVDVFNPFGLAATPPEDNVEDDDTKGKK